jgi:hypothetical protein
MAASRRMRLTRLAPWGNPLRGTPPQFVAAGTPHHLPRDVLAVGGNVELHARQGLKDVSRRSWPTLPAR